MIEVKEILEELGYVLTPDSNGFRTNRLYAGGDNRTALKIFSNGDWIDFVTSRKGGLDLLVQLTLNLKDISEAKKWLSSRKYEIKAKKIEKPSIKAEKIFSPDSLNELLPVYDYWINRGISKEVLMEFKGGLVLKDCKMKNRFVFPIFNSKNEIVGFAGRDVTEKSPIKWKLVAKKEWCYPAFLNVDIVKEKRQIILTESIGDCLSCWMAGIKNTLCLFGIEIFPAQINYLLKLNLDKIIISLNNDSNNNSVGNLAAERLQKKLNRYFDNVEILLPNLKDWNEVLVKEGIDSIKKQLNG